RFERPDEGKFILMQPWEYGYLPVKWVEQITRNVDEVWCYSSYVKSVYLASGIPEEKLHIVPLGFDPRVFRPDMPPYVFTSEPGAARLSLLTTHQSPATNHQPPRTVFLYVGGTIRRKGIDILLDAYIRAFTSIDSVLLVIKDTGVNTVYRGQNERDRILALAADPTKPPIVYVEEEMSVHRLAGMYTAADCLVIPYRGEGFCLPALEAMACGKPVIVPVGGPTDDFVNEAVGWRIPAERKLLGKSKVGERFCTAASDFVGFNYVQASFHTRAKRDSDSGPCLGYSDAQAAEVCVVSIRRLRREEWLTRGRLAVPAHIAIVVSALNKIALDRYRVRFRPVPAEPPQDVLALLPKLAPLFAGIRRDHQMPAVVVYRVHVFSGDRSRPSEAGGQRCNKIGSLHAGLQREAHVPVSVCICLNRRNATRSVMGEEGVPTYQANRSEMRNGGRNASAQRFGGDSTAPLRQRTDVNERFPCAVEIGKFHLFISLFITRFLARGSGWRLRPALNGAPHSFATTVSFSP
ncbi:MAG TPA: glycosyltransferase, partial [Chthonomonadales bacterium]|nr:glycosyltransferase [Chthonomonadales bacterium]